MKFVLILSMTMIAAAFAGCASQQGGAYGSAALPARSYVTVHKMPCARGNGQQVCFEETRDDMDRRSAN